MNLPECFQTEIVEPMKHCWYLQALDWNLENIHDLCLILSHSTAADVIMADVRLIRTQYELPPSAIIWQMLLEVMRTTATPTHPKTPLYVLGGWNLEQCFSVFIPTVPLQHGPTIGSTTESNWRWHHCQLFLGWEVRCDMTNTSKRLRGDRKAFSSAEKHTLELYPLSQVS